MPLTALKIAHVFDAALTVAANEDYEMVVHPLSSVMIHDAFKVDNDAEAFYNAVSQRFHHEVSIMRSVNKGALHLNPSNQDLSAPLDVLLDVVKNHPRFDPAVTAVIESSEVVRAVLQEENQ